jgi:isopentenyl-diphosphate delta-isomerase
MQQRADEKYHSGGLWTNTCCSHPRWGEETEDAVSRRMEEEMGMKCEAEFAFSFIYQAPFENGLTEHELDHVYIGTSDKNPSPDRSEVKNWKYVSVDEVIKDMAANPGNYTVWFKIVFEKVITQIRIAKAA